MRPSVRAGAEMTDCSEDGRYGSVDRFSGPVGGRAGNTTLAGAGQRVYAAAFNTTGVTRNAWYTAAIVEAIEAVLDATADIEHRRVVGRASAVNLVAWTRGGGPDRRLVLNGHLDTFPIGEAR